MVADYLAKDAIARLETEKKLVWREELFAPTPAFDVPRAGQPGLFDEWHQQGSFTPLASLYARVGYCLSDTDALNFVQRDLIAAAIIEASGAGRLMGGHLLRDLEAGHRS